MDVSNIATQQKAYTYQAPKSDDKAKNHQELFNVSSNETSSEYEQAFLTVSKKTQQEAETNKETNKNYSEGQKTRYSTAPFLSMCEKPKEKEQVKPKAFLSVVKRTSCDAILFDEELEVVEEKHSNGSYPNWYTI